MRIIPRHWPSLARAVAVALALIAASAVVNPVQAGSSGTLKLKVQRCSNSSWIAKAVVGVTIYRPGVGNVDSASGTTDNNGYIAFPFSDLEAGDEARVTVTPAGEFPDPNHTYYWVAPQGRDPGLWDIGIQGDQQCEDGWYDQLNNIIQCMYS